MVAAARPNDLQAMESALDAWRSDYENLKKEMAQVFIGDLDSCQGSNGGEGRQNYNGDDGRRNFDGGDGQRGGSWRGRPQYGQNFNCGDCHNCGRHSYKKADCRAKPRDSQRFNT